MIFISTLFFCIALELVGAKPSKLLYSYRSDRDGISYCIELIAVKNCHQSNEVYSDCGTACPETCDSIKFDGPVMCVADCVNGWFCIDGHVRNADGKCVLRFKCRFQ